MYQNKNIYITGFMGSGKTTIGRLLAQKLGRQFVDTDAEIENSVQMSVTDIFETKGEDFFRDLEAKTIKELDQSNNLVISLGGGAVMDPKNQKILKKGLWIFLNTPFPLIKERVMRTNHRPLGKETDKLEALYKKRLPVYQQAEVIIDCKDEPEIVCQMLLNKLLHP